MPNGNINSDALIKIKSIGATSFQGGFTHKFAEHYESDLIIAVSVCCGKENDPLPLREEVVHQVRILC